MTLSLSACQEKSDSSATPEAAATTATPSDQETASTSSEFALFFANSSFDGLEIDKRQLLFTPQATIVERAQTLWDELKKGQNSNHTALIPQELTPSSILSGQNGELIIDLPQSTIERLNLGPTWEQLLLLAITNTMTMNLPGVRSVKFLCGGSDRFSFAGHLATMQPIRPAWHE